jgi:hypothetical protein
MPNRAAIRLAAGFVVIASLTAACTSQATSSNSHSAGTASNATGGKTYNLSAAMDARQVVTPHNKPWKSPSRLAQAEGTFTGLLNSKTGKLAWHIQVTGVGGPKFMVADIHFGRKGQFGGLLARLCIPCHQDQHGVVKVKSKYVSSILFGDSWVTVFTTKYPDGVIRGQLKTR